jgi:cytosine/adenosine deaminase-related metal-dependent hydrolase
LFDKTLAGGAQALGLTGPIGIAEGATADIVTLDASHPSLTCRNGDTALDSWIFAAATSAIDSVWCLGTKVVTDGCHVRREQIETRYRSVMQKVIG